MTSLQVTNITCIREHLLFANLSFQLNKGDILLVEGPNGSGKSSLLRLLSGISTPASGEIRWQSTLIQTIREEYQKHLHYLGHESGIKSHLTVEENLGLIQHISLASSSDFSTIMNSLQLSSLKNTFIKNLSAGQKRRVALARLFLLPRTLWLLDEPFTALDAGSQEFFLTQLENHLYQGGMVVMTSHQPLILKNHIVKSLRLNSC